VILHGAVVDSPSWTRTVMLSAPASVTGSGVALADEAR
jgi:hypothetical protein